MTNFAKWLKEQGACREGYAAHHHQTEQEFWDSCQRGDWMLWVAERKYGEAGWPDHIGFVRIAAACARGALPYAGPLTDVSRAAIEAAEAFADNPCEETQDAALAESDAAWRAAWAARGSEARAALAAGYAAWVASDPIRAEKYTAFAANRAVEAAAWDAAGYDAWAAANKKVADTIRRIWPMVGQGGEA